MDRMGDIPAPTRADSAAGLRLRLSIPIELRAGRAVDGDFPTDNFHRTSRRSRKCYPAAEWIDNSAHRQRRWAVTKKVASVRQSSRSDDVAAGTLRALTTEIERQEAELRKGGGAAGHERQRKLGRLPVRERLGML